jgi:cytochrome oxidase Cu insertion factor (SCO1/SenC/PrrC family)
MIKRIAPLILLLAAVAMPVLAQQPAASPAPATLAKPATTPQPESPKTHLKVGQPAPDFTLTDTEGKQVNLHDFKGKQNVVLAFYVLAFTGG